jgi:hypothetical protein
MDQTTEQTTRILLQVAHTFHQRYMNFNDRLNQLEEATQALNETIETAFDTANATILNQILQLNGLPPCDKATSDHPAIEALELMDAYVFGDEPSVETCMKLLDAELERVRRRLEGQ